MIESRPTACHQPLYRLRPQSELKTPHNRALYEKHRKHYLMITDTAGNGVWLGPDGKSYGEWHAISSKHALALAGCLVGQHMIDQRGQIMIYRVPSWMYDAGEDQRVRELLETRK